jgi:methyltransferase
LSSAGWYTLLIALVGTERLVELAVSRRNIAWARARGGVERGLRHYPVMVVLHVGLLGGCLIEVWLGGAPFLPWLAWPMLALVVLAQALRWWCIATLGHRWNTRVVVVPGLPLIRTGPYKYLRHPNYVAVVVEGFALPLVHTAWVTALLFTVANGVLLGVRVRTEDAALNMSGAEGHGSR